MSIQLANQSIKYPIGVYENLLVKVTVDFVILEMDEDELVPIILGRPILATARAVIDVHKGNLSLRLVQEQLVDTVDHDRKWTEVEEEEDSNEVQAVSFNPRTEPVEPLKWKAPKNRLKPSSIEPPKLELKELPEHLEYAFLQENNQLPVVISFALSTIGKARLLEVLKNQKRAIAWSIADIKGIDSSFCTHKILMEDEFKPSVQPQRRVNPNIKEVVKKEVIKLLDVGLIYPISDSPWVSLVQVVPNKGGMTVVKNEKNELIPQRTVTRWRVCIDYRKLNNATRKDHFPLLFIDQMLERLAGHEYYCFLDGFSRYFQIPIALEDQEKTTFTCPYGTFTYKRMPFGLCNAPATFQRCMTAIFHELIKDSMEVFMDDFSVFGSVNTWSYPRPSFSRIILLCEIRDKKGAENLAAGHLSRLENLDLGKVTKAEKRGLFPEERLMAVSDKNNEPCNVLTESNKGASLEKRQHKSFGNVTADHLEDIMVSSLLQETSLKPVSTDHISFAMHAGWSKFAMHVNEPVISLQGTKHLKSTSKSAKYSMFEE
ncbi:DNA-directed DNA polymerase [Tanacetum coccineum]